MKRINYYNQLMNELWSPSERKVIDLVLQHLDADTREHICNMVVAYLRFGMPVKTTDPFTLATTLNIITFIDQTRGIADIDAEAYYAPILVCASKVHDPEGFHKLFQV